MTDNKGRANQGATQDQEEETPSKGQSSSTNYQTEDELGDEGGSM